MSIPFENSFASHTRSNCWSDKNKKQPRECYKSTHSKYWFDCNCGHAFESSLHHITNGCWCPYCSHKKLCDKEDCKTCLDKSFASHEKYIFWSKKNDKLPREMFKLSNKKCLFDCELCKHTFESSLHHIITGSWCPYCANQKLCDKEDCKTCLDKSFASHEKSKNWNKTNKNTPREVFKSSSKKVLFDCLECGHEFQITVYSISNNGSWCSLCVNKTETKLYERMKKTFPDIKKQFKQEWCKNITYLPFDFCIPEYKIIIELDGLQHFKQVSNWKSPEISFENDKYKEKCANDNGYSTIRILQEDVLYDKYDWCKELCEAIEIIKNGNNQRYENVDSKNHKVVNIYLCKNGEYDKFNP